jgi:hypothetical protein
MPKMTVKQLKLDLAGLPDDEEIVVVLEDGPHTEPSEWEELEPGSVCEIIETGGFQSGFRVIRAYPR